MDRQTDRDRDRKSETDEGERDRGIPTDIETYRRR